MISLFFSRKIYAWKRQFSKTEVVNMKFEDMANWTEEQLKNEVVRLADECEKKQHIILDYKALSETLNQKLLENDNFLKNQLF